MIKSPVISDEIAHLRYKMLDTVFISMCVCCLLAILRKRYAFKD